MVAMSRATWAAVVVHVCGRCGVVGGLVRDVGGSNRDVGGPDRRVGGRDRSAGGRVVDFVFRRRFAFSVADDGWDEASGDRTACAEEQRAAASVVGRDLPAAAAGTTLIGESLTAAMALPLLLAYSLSAYSAILVQSWKS